METSRFPTEEELVKKYIHHIRNARQLNLEMVDTISNMSKQNITEIISTFNDVVNNLTDNIKRLIN